MTSLDLHDLVLRNGETGMLTSLARQFIGWLDRVVDADERVVCAICDQRFGDFASGSAHVRRVHPQCAQGSWQTSPVPAYGGAARPAAAAFAQPAYALRSH